MEELEKRNESLRVTYQVKADEIFDTLEKMDKLLGTNKKQQAVFAMIMAIAAIDAYQFITTKSGFALLLMLLFLVLGVFYKKKSSFANRQLAEAFEKDPEQVVEARYTELQLTDRATSYHDIEVMYEFKKSFGLRFMKSYYFVIPKRVFTEEQLLQFREMMKAQLQEKYDDRSDKL